MLILQSNMIQSFEICQFSREVLDYKLHLLEKLPKLGKVLNSLPLPLTLLLLEHRLHSALKVFRRHFTAAATATTDSSAIDVIIAVEHIATQFNPLSGLGEIPQHLHLQREKSPCQKPPSIIKYSNMIAK